SFPASPTPCGPAAGGPLSAEKISMKRIKSLFRGKKKNNPQPQRRSHPLWFEQLEDRTLLTVGSTLASGILHVSFDSNNDAAIISVSGTNLRVSSGVFNQDFAASSVLGITAHSVSGNNQSLTLKDNVTVSNNLLVQGLANVSVADASY